MVGVSRKMIPLGIVFLAASPPPANLAVHPPNDLVAKGMHGAVVSAEKHATRVGLQVMKAGGNAIDAAIAVNAALGVVRPYSCGLGGGGFLGCAYGVWGGGGRGFSEILVECRDH